MSILTTIKAASYAVFVPFFAATGTPMEAYIALTFLLILDVFTGVLRTWLDNPKKIKSRTMLAGAWAKILLWLTFPLIGFTAIAVKGIGIDMNPQTIVNGGLAIFILAELYSLIGNIGQISSFDKNKSEYDAVTMIVRIILSKIKAILEAINPEHKK